MKTFLLIRNTHPGNFGGGETYQISLALALKRHGISPIIVSSSCRLLSEAKRQKIPTIRAPYLKQQNWSSWRNLLLPFYYFWQLYLRRWYQKLFQKYRPLAVNIQSRDDWIAATMAAKNFPTKVFWTDHADFRNWVLMNVDKKYKNLIGKQILKLAAIPDKVIMISDYEYRFFAKLIAPKKPSNLIVIKNGIEDRFTKQASHEVSIKVCFIGRIVREKGLKELIDGFNSISQEFPNLELNIYGDGPDMQEFQKLASSNPKIIFRGFINNPVSSLSKNQIFVLPSYMEGLSLALISAAMLQKIIIATNVGGNSEVVMDQNTGLLIPPHSSSAVADALRFILTHPARVQRFASNARQHYLQNFDIDKIITQQFLPLLKD